MRHAAHKAAKASSARFSVSKALFTSSRGSHTAKAVRMAQLADGGAVVGLAPEVAEKLNEVAPMSRRAMREAAKAASRKSTLVTSASLAALVGTAATALAFSQQNASRLVIADDGVETTQIKRVSDGAASRSEDRTALKESSTSNNGGWQLGETSASMDANLLSKSLADNPNVAVLMIRTARSCPQVSIRTMPPARMAAAIRTASALGGPTPVGTSWDCRSEAISAMPAIGARPRRLWAIGWTAPLAMLATSSCSLRGSRARTPITGMWRLSRRSMPTDPSRFRNRM